MAPVAEPIESKVALIQALIPLGLQAVAEVLEQEVVTLAGARYSRVGGQRGLVRWGQQQSSVYLADQKLPVTSPRVRDLSAPRHAAAVAGTACRRCGTVPQDSARAELSAV